MVRRQLGQGQHVHVHDVEALVGVLHRAMMESSHLRQQFADHAVIRTLPTQAPLGR